MYFKNREEAGKKLANALQEYAHQPDTLVIALPRGGVVVGFQVAVQLGLPLDIVCPRKIGAPINPELAIGAITETGEGILNQAIIADLSVSEGFVKTEIEKQTQEAKRRLEYYRKGRPPRSFTDKTVILVDDGLATGSTMHAAIKGVKATKAKQIILAIPVAPPDTLMRLEKEVDKTVCLYAPSAFFAVGQFYEFFDQTGDQEVVQLLLDSEKKRVC